MTKHILIIGGMGPQASVELHRRVLTVASGKNAFMGHHFPRITHLSLPIREFRSTTKHADQAIAQISDAISSVLLEKVDHAVIACNTAHLFKEAVEAQLQGRLRSLRELAFDEVQQLGAKRVGLLASTVTLQEQLYEQPLQEAGKVVIKPTLKEQSLVEQLIGRVIAGHETTRDRIEINKLSQALINRGCHVVILGCTELSVLNRRPSRNIIDPMSLAAKALND